MEGVPKAFPFNSNFLHQVGMQKYCDSAIFVEEFREWQFIPCNDFLK